MGDDKGESHPVVRFFNYVDEREWLRILLGGTLVLIIGVGVGASVQTAGDLKQFGAWATVSEVMGWTYFAAWSLSFYPQLMLNFARKSVIGMSFDYQIYNILGYTCYALFNALFFWDPSIQAEYRRKHHGHENQVQAADVFFACHGAAITVILLVQIAMFDRGDQFISRFCKVLSSVATLLAAAYAIGCACTHSSFFNWINVLEFLADIKLVVTFIKYIPQVWLNYRRKTTDGLNIDNFLLDFVGGVLSLAQLLLDSGLTHDWSAVEGDIAKFGLGVIAIIFDTIIITQHYIIYRSARLKNRKNSVVDESSQNGETSSHSIQDGINDGVSSPGSESDERQPLLSGQSANVWRVDVD